MVKLNKAKWYKQGQLEEQEGLVTFSTLLQALIVYEALAVGEERRLKQEAQRQAALMTHLLTVPIINTRLSSGKNDNPDYSKA